MTFRIENRLLLALSLLYVVLPLGVFLVGWCRWYIYIPLLVVCLFVGKRLFNVYSSSENGAICLNGYAFIVVLSFFLLMAYYLGWGRFTEQMNDYGKHNAVLNDLILRPWPVIYTNVHGEHSMLTYYLGHYMIPACVGKVFGSYRVGEIAFAFWSLVGLVLAYLNLVRHLKCGNSFFKALGLSVVLFFFSCPLSLASPIIPRLYEGVYVSSEWFWWSEGLKLQYSSNWCLLQWVAPQVLAAWVVIPIFLRHFQRVDLYVPLLLPLLFTSAFAFLGLLPFAIVGAVLTLAKYKRIVPWLRRVFSIENVLFTFTVGFVLFLYFIANIKAPKPAEVSFRFLDYSDLKMLYVLFVCTMILPYFVSLFLSQRKNTWYWLSLLILLVLPLVTMGLMNDLMMRASIPALFILMIMVLDYMFDFEWKKHNVVGRFNYVFMICLVVFSARFPLKFLLDQIQGDDICALAPDKSYVTMEQFTDRKDASIRVDRKYNYFTYDLDSSMFYRFIAERRSNVVPLNLIPVPPPDQIKQ